MKLTPQTLVAVILAAGLGAFLYYWEVGQSTPTTLSWQQSPQLFQFLEEEVEMITIKTQQQTLKFQATTSGEWQMLQPLAVKASNASVGFLINLLISAQVYRRFDVTAEQKSNYSLLPPQAEITIQLKQGESHQLLLGSLNFDQTLVYGLVDSPPEEANTAVLLPVSFWYAVNRELWEWHQSE